MSYSAQIFIDNVDITNFALSGSYTRRLSGVSVAQVTVPFDMTDVFQVGSGSLMRIYADGTLVSHTRLLQREITAGPDGGTVVFNGADPLELWSWRPVRGNSLSGQSSGATDVTCSFIDPTILDDYVTGPQIIEAMFDSSQNDSPPGLFDANAEGPLFLVKGSFAGGGVDLSGAPVDWPMTMEALAALLVSTGEVDIVITPIELTPGAVTNPDCSSDLVDCYGQIDVFNGDFGDDLTASVFFQYGMGLHNIQAFRFNSDMTNMVNKLEYFLGPRIDQNHWQANVVGTDTAGFADCDIYINDIEANAIASRCDNGCRMLIQTYDDKENEANLAPCLFKRRWAIEAYLRANNHNLIHITPTRDTDIVGVFDIGDLITVEATPDAYGGFSGAQRVYEYTVSWDEDSVLALEELQVSSDNEGFVTTAP